MLQLKSPADFWIICVPSKGSATGTVPTTVLSYSDYISRPEERVSVVRFDKGEREKHCRVVIIDDSLYEAEESFNVSLSLPMGGRLGTHYPTTKVNILEDADDGKLVLGLGWVTVSQIKFRFI